MTELLWSAGIVLAAFVCAAIGKALFRRRSAPPLTHHSYEPEPYDGSLTDDEQAQWAEIEARLRSEDRTQ